MDRQKDRDTRVNRDRETRTDKGTGTEGQGHQNDFQDELLGPEECVHWVWDKEAIFIGPLDPLCTKYKYTTSLQ